VFNHQARLIQIPTAATSAADQLMCVDSARLCAAMSKSTPITLSEPLCHMDMHIIEMLIRFGRFQRQPGVVAATDGLGSWRLTR
jgi:hypothetical protein